MRRADALNALERLEELIKGFGYPDEGAKRTAKHLVFALRGTPLGTDGYYLEKLGKLERCIDEGFSTRKFAKRPGGADQVRVFAPRDISTARSLIDHAATTICPRSACAGSAAA